jgi:hypothetical protein
MASYPSPLSHSNNPIKSTHLFEHERIVWRVNGECRPDILKSLIGQLESMLDHHSKVFVIRFDLRIYDHTLDNNLMTIFNRHFHRWIKRKYSTKRIGFGWVREQERAKHQHYHYALFLDGHKINQHWEITNRAMTIWDNLNGSLWVPDNPTYMLHRSDTGEIQKAIYRVSYLAKKRGKGMRYRPAQTKDYGSSRIQRKATADRAESFG